MRTKITLLILMIASLGLNAQNIEFTFDNAQTTNDGANDFYEVDVMIATVDGQADFKLGKGQVYINFNTAAFGSNINAGGGLEITHDTGYILSQANVLDYYSTFTANDNSSSRFSFAYQQGINSGSMVDNVTNIPAKLFHIKMTFTDFGEMPMVAFEDDETQVAGCRDQFETACGPSAAGLAVANCGSEPGIVFNDALFDSGGATLSAINNDLAQVLTVYPNPAEETLYVNINRKSDYSVIDIFGKIVKTGKVEQGENELDIKNYQAGIYFLKLSNEKGSVIKKVLKE
jgi:hypothetical protein